jgi:PAS domain S-box-containing protein
MIKNSQNYLVFLHQLAFINEEEEIINRLIEFIDNELPENKILYTRNPTQGLPIQIDGEILGYLTSEKPFNDEMIAQINLIIPIIASYIYKIRLNVASKNQYKEIIAEKEEKYHSFFSQISEGVYRFDLQKPIDTSLSIEEQMDFIYDKMYLADCNLAFVKMYGLNKEEDLIGTTMRELHKPEIYPENKQVLREFIENGYKIKEYESKEEDKNGDIHYFLNNSIGIIKEGWLYRIWGTQTDITDRKLSMNALLESETRYKSLFNATFEAIIIHENGEVLAVNNAFEKLFKIKKEHAVGQHCSKYVAPEEVELLKEVIANPMDEPYQLIGQKSNGKKFVADINGKTIFYQGRKVRMAAIRDITLQHKIDSTLRESEEKYRLLFDSISDCAFLHGYNMQLQPTHFVEVNSSACNTLEYTKKELLKLKPKDTSYNVEDTFFEKIAKQLLKNHHIIYEMDVKTKSGKILRMENSSHLFKYKKNKYTLTVSRDITERKKSERVLKQKNEELLQANQELDNFVYRVSHDLRAPIASSLGLAELMQKETHIDNVKTFSKLQAQSLVKLDNFINEILHYSRNARLKIAPVEISAKKLIESVVSPFMILESSKNVKFDYIIEGGSKFYTDKQRIEIVMNNLVSNAFKYRNSNQLEQFIRISFHIRPKLVTIKITDNGIGIKPEYQQKIFDMFVRATENNTGSGLGLYIVKESLKKIKGRISLYSEYGKGSEFVIDIPNMVPRKTAATT